MVILFNVETHAINYYLKKIFYDSKLIEDSVARNFRITAKMVTLLIFHQFEMDYNIANNYNYER